MTKPNPDFEMRVARGEQCPKCRSKRVRTLPSDTSAEDFYLCDGCGHWWASITLDPPEAA